jgi:hypothetical protein
MTARGTSVDGAGDALATPLVGPPEAVRAQAFDSFESAPTDVSVESPGVERQTPTEIEPVAPGSPTEIAARAERSDPIQVISMKDRAGGAPAAPKLPRVPLHVQLRSIAEASKLTGSTRSLGHLAPPLDPRQARARQLRRYAGRAAVAIALAGTVALAIWLVAG